MFRNALIPFVVRSVNSRRQFQHYVILTRWRSSLRPSQLIMDCMICAFSLIAFAINSGCSAYGIHFEQATFAFTVIVIVFNVFCVVPGLLRKQVRVQEPLYLFRHNSNPPVEHNIPSSSPAPRTSVANSRTARKKKLPRRTPTRTTPTRCKLTTARVIIKNCKKLTNVGAKNCIAIHIIFIHSFYIFNDAVTELPPPNLVFLLTCKLSKFMTNVLLSEIPASNMVLLASMTWPWNTSCMSLALLFTLLFTIFLRRAKGVARRLVLTC